MAHVHRKPRSPILSKMDEVQFPQHFRFLRGSKTRMLAGCDLTPDYQMQAPQFRREARSQTKVARVAGALVERPGLSPRRHGARPRINARSRCFLDQHLSDFSLIKASKRRYRDLKRTRCEPRAIINRPTATRCSTVAPHDDIDFPNIAVGDLAFPK